MRTTSLAVALGLLATAAFAAPSMAQGYGYTQAQIYSAPAGTPSTAYSVPLGAGSTTYVYMPSTGYVPPNPIVNAPPPDPSFVPPMVATRQSTTTTTTYSVPGARTTTVYPY